MNSSIAVRTRQCNVSGSQDNNMAPANPELSHISAGRRNRKNLKQLQINFPRMNKVCEHISLNDKKTFISSKRQPRVNNTTQETKENVSPIITNVWTKCANIISRNDRTLFRQTNSWDIVTWMLDPWNICVAAGISSLTCLQAESLLVLWSPSWTSHFRLSRV